MPSYAGVELKYATSEQTAPAALRALKSQVGHMMIMPGLKAHVTSQAYKDKKRLASLTFTELPNTTQPNAVDTLKPSAGVTLKFQQVQKRGPPLDTSTVERMTKKSFLGLAKILARSPNPALPRGRGEKKHDAAAENSLPSIGSSKRSTEHQPTVAPAKGGAGVKLPPV